MKNLSKLNLKTLSYDESCFTNGGSEFSESVFRGVGWVVGAIVSCWESFVENQARMDANGLHPAL